MTRVLLLYYSMYGHVKTLAHAVAAGARSVAGTDVTVKRMPELMSEDLARKAGAKLEYAASLATVDELPPYDAIIFGTPTRFGNMCAPRPPSARERADVADDPSRCGPRPLGAGPVPIEQV